MLVSVMVFVLVFVKVFMLVCVMVFVNMHVRVFIMEFVNVHAMLLIKPLPDHNQSGARWRFSRTHARENRNLPVVC